MRLTTVSHRKVLTVPKPWSGAKSGLGGAGVSAGAHLEQTLATFGVAAKQGVGYGALAHSGLSHDYKPRIWVRNILFCYRY